MNNTMTDEMLNEIKGHQFKEGVIYALEYLSTLYDGVEKTDLWKEYISEEANN